MTAEPRPGDILGALAELGLISTGQVRVSGSEAYVLCPYHEDRSAGSFAINIETGLNHCFSCGNGGSFRKYLMASQDMDRQQARRWCLNRLIATTASGEYRQEHLPAEPEVTEASLAVFEDPPETVLREKGISLASCRALGILWAPETGHLIFPVRHPYTGRFLGWQEKTSYRFRNHPRRIPVKSCLFGWELIRPQDTPVLVESPVDVAVMRDAGYPAVSSYGAVITRDQLSLIADQCRSLVLALDDDEAGWRATGAILASFRSIPVRVFSYGADPAGKDPGELTREQIQRGMTHLLC